MTLREKMLANGVKESELDNHCSDLYVKVTEQSAQVINNYDFKCNVKTFRSAIDNTLWYDIPFAYDEYHQERNKI